MLRDSVGSCKHVGGVDLGAASGVEENVTSSSQLLSFVCFVLGCFLRLGLSLKPELASDSQQASASEPEHHLANAPSQLYLALLCASPTSYPVGDKRLDDAAHLPI